MTLFIKSLFIFILSTSIYASQKLSVLVIHSYSQEYEWTKKQHNSFVSTLQESTKDFEILTEYLDTKRLKLTPEYQDKFLQYIKFKYKNSNIDLIYVTDDNAMRFLYNKYSELTSEEINIPVFFSGVNNLEMDNVLDKNYFKGVYEVKQIYQNIELVKQFSPQTRDIWFIGDNSSTYYLIKKEIELQRKNFPNMNFHYISDEKISKIQENLPDDKRSFLILTTIGNFKDAKNNTLLPKESIKIIKQQEGIIILSMEDSYMTKGVVGGYVTSGIQQGKKAAKLVLKYINENSLKNIKSILNSPNKYIFNYRELINARVILSEYIARDSIMIGKDKSFIEKNNYTLLNILSIILTTLALIFFILYSIQRKKYNEKSRHLEKLQAIDLESEFHNQLLHNSLSLGGLGYWTLDVDKNKIFISEELINMLEIDTDLCKDDPSFLNYFLNTKDKKTLFDNTAYVISSKKSTKFNHKIMISEKSVFEAKHIIFVENKKNDDALSIVGIIKFDN